MPRIRTAAAAMLLTLMLCGTSESQSGREGLAPLRELAGDWVVINSENQPTGLRARYEVLAGGSVVMSRFLVGTSEETVTLFHGDGGLVTGTHVSARSGPVRLALAVAAPADVLTFANLDEEAVSGLAEVRMTRLEPDRLRVVWTMRTGEDQIEDMSFELRRETSLADLAAEVSRTRASLETLQSELDRRLKAEITIDDGGRPGKRYLETRTFPFDGGWNVFGVPLRVYRYEQTIRFASTYAAEGDGGMAVAHHPFKAGSGAHARFSVMGGHAYIALVAETKAPPRRIPDIRAFNEALLAGTYGEIVESTQGGRSTRPLAVDWDLSRFEGKAMRFYVVDAESNHYGQISVSEISIVEDVKD